MRTSTRTVIIDLWGDLWESDIASNTTRKQELINSIFDSNRAATDVGFENSMEAVYRNLYRNLRRPLYVLSSCPVVVSRMWGSRTPWTP